jgi:hypothetical protein
MTEEVIMQVTIQQLQGYCAFCFRTGFMYASPVLRFDSLTQIVIGERKRSGGAGRQTARDVLYDL